MSPLRPLLPLLPLLVVLALPAATVQLLDGTTRTGGTLVLADGVLTLDGAAIPLAEIDWFGAAGSGPPAAAPPETLVAALNDGGVLPVTRVTSDADDTITLAAGAGRLSLPLGVVTAWGPLGVLAARPAAQDLVVLDRGPLLGAIQGLQGGRLLMKTSLSDDPVSLPLGQVQALRLAQPSRTPSGPHLAVALVPGCQPLLLAPVWPPALALDPATPLDPAIVASPLFAARRCVVRGGRRTYLSTLAPAAVAEEGAFGVVWPHARDANLDGTPCFLGGVHYDRCLVVHSKARLTWRLDGGYERFHALVGISDALGAEGDCDVRIEGDGRVLWEHRGITGGAAPLPCDLTGLDGVVELVLVVDYGGRYDIGDHLVLADVWLARRPG
jgi:hypothetical protein